MLSIFECLVVIDGVVFVGVGEAQTFTDNIVGKTFYDPNRPCVAAVTGLEATASGYQRGNRLLNDSRILLRLVKLKQEFKQVLKAESDVSVPPKPEHASAHPRASLAARSRLSVGVWANPHLWRVCWAKFNWHMQL